MPAAPSVPARHRAGVALRLGLAAALVGGVAAALPSSAAEAVYTDDTGYLELPAPLVSSADYTFDFLTCPDAPPNQGVDAWVYELPAEVAVAGAPVTVTATDASGSVDATAYVYDDSCAYNRFESSDGALTFPLLETDRYLAVTTGTGVGTDLLLEVGPAGTSTGTASPSPTTSEPAGPAEPTSGVRRDYSGGVNDPFYPEPADFVPTDATGAIAPGGQWGMRVIQAEQAWQVPQATGAGVTVAVLDSGLDVTHEDFQCDGKLARLDPVKYSRFADVTDTDGHGTHVAGIVGACTDNGTGVVGAAPDATILPIQALSPDEATAERLAAAIDAAVESGAHVINMSLGFSAQGVPGTGSAIALVGGFASTIDPAIERAVAAGVVVVAAAGNESFPLCGYPALAEDVVCVGSTDRRDLNAYYSNFPLTPSGTALMAPGGSGQLFCDVQSENILSTYSTQAENGCAYPAPGYRGLDGTSMAAPHVAGVAALVYDRLGGQRSPEAATQVVTAMTSTAVDLYTAGYDPLSGEGRVDALGAVRAVTAVTPTPTGTASPSPSPSPTQTTPQEAPTVLELVAPATGQTTDELPLQARLSQGDDERVAGADVLFRLSAGDVERTVTATTGDDGVARAALPLDVAPGGYVLTASYAGEPAVRTASSDEQPLEVQREDSDTTLSVEGKGGNRVLRIGLADADTASRGVAGASVAVFADGRQVGTVTTGDDGTAAFTPSGSARSAKTYEAVFSGDGTYAGSSERASA